MFRKLLSANAISCLLIMSSSTTSFAAEKDSNVANYDVFAITGSELTATLDQLNGQLDKFNLTGLSKTGRVPHITLYLTEYNRAALSKLKQDVRKISDNWHSSPVELASLTRTKDNWLMISVRDNGNLQKMSDAVVNSAATLRYKDAQMPSWVNSYPEKKESFQKYGSPNVFANFQPHITVLTPSDASALTQFMDAYGNHFKPAEIHVNGIGIAEVDDNGQVKKIVAEYLFDNKRI